MTLHKGGDIHVLAIDDDSADLLLTERLLEEISDWRVVFHGCTEPKEGLKMITDKSVDLAIIDYFLGDTLGTVLLKSIKELDKQFPVIIATGSGSEAIAVQAMRYGASDYLVKGASNSRHYARAILNALQKADLEREVHDKQTKLEQTVRELRASLAHIKQLQRLLPICMHCKRIRDDRDSWQQIEEYMTLHADVKFSHSLCYECKQKHYPELTGKKSPARK
jgi:DNA-binding NtrC family response regulator